MPSFSSMSLLRFRYTLYCQYVSVGIFWGLIFLSASGYAFGMIEMQKAKETNIAFVFSVNTDKKDSMQWDVLRFYVSSVQICSQGKIIASDSSGYHLIDLNDSLRNSFTLKTPISEAFDEVRFCIGVDSIASTSGAMEGDLNPSEHMYWTWQSGYIFVKMEGKVKRNPFEYHLGGYAFPNKAIQELHFDTGGLHKLRFAFDAHHFFAQLPANFPSVLMRPCREATLLMQHFAAAIHLEK